METPAGSKVLIVITKSNWGGAQSYVYQLATGFMARGIDVVVAFGGTGLPGADTGLLAERLASAGIRTAGLSSFTRDIGLVREFRAFAELLGVIRSERPDVLHLNSSKAGGLGALAARLAGIRCIIFTAHGWAHREPRSSSKRALIWLVSWATIALSHRVIAVSDLDRKDAPVFFSRRKIALVHNGINAFPLMAREEARRALTKFDASLPQTGRWILMLAELTVNKGVDVALAALARIKDEYPDAILVVLGAGEMHDALEKRVRELALSSRAFLLGFVADGRSYLRAADIFTLTSHKEGFPMCLLEAGVAQVPVVASDVGGIGELLVPDGGLLAPAGNSEAFAAAWAGCFEHGSEAARMAQTLHARVASDFSEAVMLDATLRVYEGRG